MRPRTCPALCYVRALCMRTAGLEVIVLFFLNARQIYDDSGMLSIYIRHFFLS